MREDRARHLYRCAAIAGLLVAAVVLLGQGSAVTALPQCSMARYDARCTGWSNLHATYAPSLVWTMNTTYATTPVIGRDGSLYLGNGFMTFRSYTSDGMLRWTYQTGLVSGPAALGADDSVYIPATGRIVALTSLGTDKWASPFVFTYGASPSPLILGWAGTLYFGADDKKVYAVNPDGSARWVYTTGGAVRYSCAVSPDGLTVYAASGDGCVYALDASTGILKWKTAAISCVYNCAVGADGTIYVGSTNGKLYAFAPDGTQKWAFQSQSKVTCAPAIAPDGTIYFGSQDTNLYALDADGRLKWKYRTNGPVYSAPTLAADGTVIVGVWPAILIALDPSDGSVNWKRTLTSQMYSAPIIDQAGSIYALSNDGVLAKFSGPQAPEPSCLIALSSLLAACAGISYARRRLVR